MKHGFFGINDFTFKPVTHLLKDGYNFVYKN
jgi:hypothetical protein